MHRPDSVEFRPTVWDSITELGDDQLKKFAQYLLNDLPRKVGVRIPRMRPKFLVLVPAGCTETNRPAA